MSFENSIPIKIAKYDHYSLFLFVLMLVAACSSQGDLQDEETLKRSLKIERTFLWAGIGFTGEVTLKPDQTASLRINGHGADDGQWHLQDDTVCTIWQRAAEGQKRCAKIFRQFDGTYLVRAADNGVKLGVIELKTKGTQ